MKLKTEVIYMANKQCFMPFFYDWVKPLSALNKEDCAELILAMVNYHENGGEIPEFTGMTGIAANFIFPQLERAREVSNLRADSGAKGGKANRSKRKLQIQIQIRIRIRIRIQI